MRIVSVYPFWKLWVLLCALLTWQDMSFQPARILWCLLIIPFCCLQWSWLCPSSQHGRGHRWLALGIQGEFFLSTHGAEPFSVKSASSLGFGLLVLIVLKDVSSGRTLCCLMVRNLVFKRENSSCRASRTFMLLHNESRHRWNCTAARAGAGVPLTWGHTWNGYQCTRTSSNRGNWR